MFSNEMMFYGFSFMIFILIFALVFTNVRINKLNDKEIISYHSDEYLSNLKSFNETLKIDEVPFSSNLTPLELNFNEDVIENYERDRNFPAINATSKLGVHLRFGTKSVRELVLRSNSSENKTFLKELILNFSFAFATYYTSADGDFLKSFFKRVLPFLKGIFKGLTKKEP